MAIKRDALTFKHEKSMKKFALMVLALCTSSAAFAADYKYGIDVLQSSSDIACDNVQEVIINPLWNTSCEDTSIGYRVSYAAKIHPTYYFELAYLDFGEVEWNGHFAGFEGEASPSVIDRQTAVFGASGIEVIGRKDFSVTQSGAINLFAGLTYSKGTYKFSEYREDPEVPNSGWTESFSDSEKNMSPMFGIGFSYKHVVIAYKIHKDIGSGEAGDTDISTLNLGLRI
jgi:hypothetical protein